MTAAELRAITCPYTKPHSAASFRLRIGRIEDYLYINGDHMTAREAAKRLGIHPRTVERYRAFLRQHRNHDRV